jgi:hypothetical protein
MWTACDERQAASFRGPKGPRFRMDQTLREKLATMGTGYTCEFNRIASRWNVVDRQLAMMAVSFSLEATFECEKLPTVSHEEEINHRRKNQGEKKFYGRGHPGDSGIAGGMSCGPQSNSEADGCENMRALGKPESRAFPEDQARCGDETEKHGMVDPKSSK